VSLIENQQTSSKGTWAITLTGNYRIMFAPEGTDMKDVNLEDYH